MGDWFRVLQRSWIVAMFSLGALSALGLEALLRPAARRGAQAARALMIAAITGALVLLAPPSIKGVVLAAGLIVILLAAPFPSGRARTLVALGVLAFLVLELDRSIPVNPSILPYVGEDFRGLSTMREPLVWAHMLDPGRRVAHQEWVFFSQNTPKLGTLLRIPVFSDYEPFIPKRYLAWNHVMSGAFNETGPDLYMGTANLIISTFNPRFLDYAAVGHVILLTFSEPEKPPCVQGMNLIRKIPLPSIREMGARDEGLYMARKASVFRNPFAWPRVFLAREVRRVKSGEEALGLLARLPRGTAPLALVEAASSIRLPAAAPEGSDATMVASEPERIEIRTSASKEALLVLADTYFPGWHAEVDARETPILRANYLFRAVAVPAGVHSVVFTYRPLSVRIGLGLGALGLAGAAATALAGLRNRRGKLRVGEKV